MQVELQGLRGGVCLGMRGPDRHDQYRHNKKDATPYLWRPRTGSRAFIPLGGVLLRDHLSDQCLSANRQWNRQWRVRPIFDVASVDCDAGICNSQYLEVVISGPGRSLLEGARHNDLLIAFIDKQR